ncbi:hypothetical protein LUW77_24195 [Streptomyces radiopugnans]|nr:hypothetical protein LUW77_24195 [Streptomyces radiopugnans]
MALTNNEKVLRGFDQLLEGMRPWVDMRMSAQAPKQGLGGTDRGRGLGEVRYRQDLLARRRAVPAAHGHREVEDL